MRRTQEIDNGQDIIDSRDVIARIEQLESQTKEVSHHDDDCAEGCESEACTVEILDLDEDEEAELTALKGLASEGEGYGDWAHGEALIRDSYFEDYARQLAEDLGYISGDEHWPHTCIDWTKAVEELQQDYTQVDFDGVAYWMRS